MNKLEKIQKFVLSNKNFLFLWFAQIITQSAVSIVTILVGILSDEGVISSSAKQSSASIGIIIDLAMFPALFIAPIAGAVADRVKRKKIMLLSNIIRFIFLFVYTIFHGWNNLLYSYSLVLFSSIVLQFFIPAEGGLIPKLVEKKYILLANSLFSLTVYSTMAVGVTLSGLILNIFGIKMTFAVCSLFFIISSVLLLFVKVKETPVKREEGEKKLFKIFPSIIRDVKEGIIYSFKNKKLRFALIHLFLLQVVALILVTIVFRIGNEIYGVSPRTAGVVVFAPIIIGLLTGVVTLNTFFRNMRRPKLIWLGTIFSSISFGFMFLISIGNGILSELFLDEVIATLSLIGIGISIPFLLIPAQALIYERTKTDYRSRVLGIWQALTSSFASIVATVFGFINDEIGNISVAILQIVIVDLIYSAIILFLLKKRKI